MREDVRAELSGVQPGVLGWVPWSNWGWVRVRVERVSARGVVTLRRPDSGRTIKRPWRYFVRGDDRPEGTPGNQVRSMDTLSR